MSGFLQDFRFGFRLLKKSPLFAATAILLLAIGISGNTLLFSIVNALLLRDLPVAHPETLVRLIEVHAKDFITWDMPYDLGRALAEKDLSLSEVLVQGQTDVPLSEGNTTERVRVHLVSPNFFSSLEVRPYLGRLLNAADEREQSLSAVLSYDFWRRRFQSDPAILGKQIKLAGHPFTVVGVSPEGFNGLAADTSPDLRVPASTDRSLLDRDPDLKPGARPLFAQIFGRLRPGIPIERASREVDPLLQLSYVELLNRIFPGQGSDRDSRLQLEPVAKGTSALREQFSRGLQVLMAGAGLLLLMACANITGLLLARSIVRSREVDIRLSLGASPFQLARQFLTEGLILAFFGGIAGTALTVVCLPLVTRLLPPIRDRAAVLQPLQMHIVVDLSLLAFSLAVTLLTAVLSSLWPGARAAYRAPAGSLRAGRAATSRLAPRNLIVIVQVAICTLLLIGAALLFQTLQGLRSMDPGFDRDHVITFTLDPALKGYRPAQSLSLSKALLEKAAALPGVRAASLASRALMRGTGVKMTIGPAGTRITPQDFLNASSNQITPGYFETLGLHLLSGRDFTWFDRDQKPRKVIVNQVLAQRFFPGRNPLGERIGYAGPDGLAKGDNEIIGVVSDAKYRSLREPVPPTAYVPAVDGFTNPFVLHLRTGQDPASLIEPVRETLRALDPEMPFVEVRTLRQEVDASLWQEGLLSGLSLVFGGIAALVAAIGLYALVDYAVKSRTREIGVRKALGAPETKILGLLSGELVALIGAGITLGLGACAAAAPAIRSVLYGVAPWDPGAIGVVLFAMAALAVLAAAPAAWRALRIDPASALRAE